jgi:hypothetical protein
MTHTFASQAERTLQQYTQTPEGKKPAEALGCGHKCHGCDGPHPFACCPDKDKPAVAARAKRNHTKFFEDKLKGKRGRWQKKNPDLSDVPPSVHAKITQQVLHAAASPPPDSVSANPASVASSVTGATISPHAGNGMGRGSTQGGRGGGPFIFIGDIQVFSSATKETLPVPINTALPHIELQLGASDMKGDSPTIPCILDTAAALSTGNSHFFFQIAKTFPGSVAAIYTNTNYSNIVLYGIVQHNSEAVTTDLCVAFLFNLPYFMVDGQPAQIIFAAGPHVNVNCIVGSPFLSAARTVIDYNDNVAELRALDCPPFPIDFKRARLCMPDVQASLVNNYIDDHKQFLADLEVLEALVHNVDVMPPPAPTISRKVHFNHPRESRNPSNDGLLRVIVLLLSCPMASCPGNLWPVKTTWLGKATMLFMTPLSELAL